MCRCYTGSSGSIRRSPVRPTSPENERAVMQSSMRLPILFSLLLALPFDPAATRDALAADYSPIVKTTGGSVKGAQAEGFPDVTVYRGIPFAAAPTGALRWREPQPMVPWQGIREPLAAV